MPHTAKKRKAQERIKHPKNYTRPLERIKPGVLADCLLIAIEDKSITIEEIKSAFEDVIRRYGDKKDNT